MTGARIRIVPTDALSAVDVTAIRAILDAAFGDDEEERFGEDDWQHALGGAHVVASIGDDIVAHAAVVERRLHVGGRPLRTGYVEAVATDPSLQGRGIGTLVMRAVGAQIAAGFELGALGTGAFHFYERLGWVRWRGPSSVRLAAGGERPTPDDDGYILVLATPTSPLLDFDAPISCEWRRGDVW